MLSSCFSLETSLSEPFNSFDDIHGLSEASCDQTDTTENNVFHVYTQETLQEGLSFRFVFISMICFSQMYLVTNTYEKGIDQTVKKIMKNIMVGKSVIYTKTDLTQICNKPKIRIDAIKRLVEANLLIHGNNFWVEPSRSKKESKAGAKLNLKEGWIKQEFF